MCLELNSKNLQLIAKNQQQHQQLIQEIQKIKEEPMKIVPDQEQNKQQDNINDDLDSLVQTKSDNCLDLSAEDTAQLYKKLIEEKKRKNSNLDIDNKNFKNKKRNKNDFTDSEQKVYFKLNEYVSINKDIDAVSSISSKSVKYLHKKRLEERGYRMTNKKLGEGGYGAVYKVYLKNAHPSVKPLACKIMLLSRRDKSAALENCANEINAMKCSKHINIVSNTDSFIYSHALSTDNIIMSHSYILMEYAELGTLWAKLKKYGPFNEETTKDYFKQIANGILHLHLQGIAHRDLKLGNILLTGNDKCQEIVKLADFGLSRVVNSKESGVIKFSKPAGTLAYMSPQIIQCYINNNSERRTIKCFYDPFSADLWALGVCLYLLLTKSHPFDNPPPNKAERIIFAKKMLEKQMQKEWSMPTGINGGVMDSQQALQQINKLWFVYLLDRLLEPYCANRMNIYDVNQFLDLRNQQSQPLQINSNDEQLKQNKNNQLREN